MPTSALTITATVLALMGLLLFLVGMRSLRAKQYYRTGTSLVLSLMLAFMAALVGLVAVSTQGYRALTRERTAAVVEVQPTGAKSFDAVFTFPDGRTAAYHLRGDQLYVDARILKWKPIANLLGVETAYKLDRVSGRYFELKDEQSKPRTVYALSRHEALDLFELRLKYAILRPLVDAEYGSASYLRVDKPATFDVQVSITGLLLRRVPPRKKAGTD